MPFLVKNRVSEWKCCIFFFQCCIFFSRLLNLSEWVDLKLFLGKKYILVYFLNTTQKLEKIRKVPKNSVKYLFLDLFLVDIWFFSSEWLANFSWEKKSSYFFSKMWKKNKILPNRVSEWRVNYSREKIKYGTFADT